MTTTTDRATAVGVFDSEAAAERAVTELRDRGFPAAEIGTAAGTAPPESASPRAGLGTALVLIVGAGAMAGYAAAWVLLFYPAVYTAYVGGAAAAGLAVAAAVWAAIEFARGSAAGRRAAAVTPAYETDLRAGRAVVTVHAAGRYDEAMATLRRHGAAEPGVLPAAA
jgi:hypothetical protein